MWVCGWADVLYRGEYARGVQLVSAGEGGGGEGECVRGVQFFFWGGEGVRGCVGATNSV